jgi:ankyrin repeat protein
MFAVALPDPDAAALLIAAGADVNARDAAGRSVLINTVLTAADRTANVRLLMQARADLNAKDNDNRTALAWAIRKGQTAIAQLLKKSGAAEW